MRSSEDFQYSTPFSIDNINEAIISSSPRGMIDLLYLDAAAFDSIPVHEDLFVDPLHLEMDKRPNQLTKWIVEKELSNDLDYGLIREGDYLI